MFLSAAGWSVSFGLAQRVKDCTLPPSPRMLVVASERTVSSEPGARRVFAVTPAGARALAETKAMRERLWAGVKLNALLRNA